MSAEVSLRRAAILCIIAVLLTAQGGAAMDSVAKWGVYEIELESAIAHESPFVELSVTVSFEGPDGRSTTIDAFWDGGRTWRARFAPDVVGRWSWRSACQSDEGLDGREGQFQCVAAGGEAARGPLEVSADNTHLEHADRTPCFWLADTAWNGALRSNAQEWGEYLRLRREQGFTAVQFVTTQWRGWPTAEVFLLPQGEDGPAIPNIPAYQRLDERLRAVNEAGLVAAPVMLWTLTEEDPGQVLSEDAAIRLCRYMRARWAAYNVVWLLGGDGRYNEEQVAARWRRIGRAVFEGGIDRPATMHPCGTSWVGEEFGDEEWFDFLGYQSGHGLPERTSAWIAMGPPAMNWKQLGKPVINLEPNYEGFPAYGSEYRISAHDVRRAAWLSLLVTPTAGVSYGTNPIWVWGDEIADAPGHGSLKSIPPWRQGLYTDGITSMSALRRIIDRIEWWRLRPAQDRLVEQPGTDDARRFIAVAASDAGDLLVAYTPEGDAVALAGDLPANARWYDPRTGKAIGAEAHGGRFQPPAEEDWLLVMTE